MNTITFLNIKDKELKNILEDKLITDCLEEKYVNILKSYIK